MKAKLNVLLGIAILFSSVVFAQDGAVLFKNNCAVCHSVGKGKLVGPDLKGSHTRFENEWLKKWIKSSQSLVKKGDPTAVKIFEENGKMVMPDQNLSEAEIVSVIEYVKAESEKPEEVAQEKPKENPAGTTVKSEPYDYHKKDSNSMSWQAATYALAGFCIVLLIVILALANTVSGLAGTVNNNKVENRDTPPQV